MNVVALIFYVAALVCLVLAVLGVGGRVNTLALGLACWLVASVFVPLLA